MTSFRRCAQIFLLLSLAAMQAACSSPDPNRRLTTNWIIQPTDVATEPVRVESGGTVIRQTLHPDGAAQLSADVQHGTGEDDLLAEGTVLYRVRNPVANVYCATNLANTSTLNAIFLNSTNAQRCLVDEDQDGAFESAFTVRSPIEGVPIVNGLLPTERRPIEPPVAYEKAEPSIVGDTYWVEIEYRGRPLLYDRRNFGIQYGNDRVDQRLTSFQHVDGDELPQSLNMLGSSFTVLEEDDDGLLIRIDRPMAPLPFSVTQITTYSYY